MRRFRPLLLLAIVVILAGVGAVYRTQKERQARNTPALPKSLPAETSATMDSWCLAQTQSSRTEVQICAKTFKQLKSPNRAYLEGVEVQIFHRDGASFDRFKTAIAEFDTQEATLFADGDVEITAGEPVGDRQAKRRISIKTSGLTFESKSGRAYTDRPATFEFESGHGSSVGASYDPELREFVMRKQASVTYRGQSRKARPLTVETDELIYKEKDSAIIMGPWSRMKRANMAIEGGRSVVWIKDGEIDRLEAAQAHGVDRPAPDRQVEYAAGQLYIDFGEGGEVETMTADKNARLSSTAKSVRNTVTADRLDLAFDLSSKESQLTKALANGHSVIESVPAISPKTGRPPTRVLRSDLIELAMQPGGQEIRSVETRTPGVIEFLPNQPNQSKRRLEGDRIYITYAPGNNIRSLQATKATTRTEPPPPAPGKPAPPAMLTWSKQLTAEFNPAESQLTQLEQSGDFRYEEGARQGRAEQAVLRMNEGLITLTKGARFWDPDGSLSADRIALNQKSGDVTAEGSVTSTRQPESDKKSSAVLSQAEPFHATAARMFIAGGNRLIRYEGDAVVWQGGNRIEAARVEIDRAKQTLAARDNVRSRFVEQSKDPKKKGAAPVFTLINAQEMLYADKTRTAEYHGGVSLNRGVTQVNSDDLRGVFAVKDGSSELETAVADGHVRITQSAAGRTRKGSGEHAEFAVAEGKVVLSGGAPEFVDSLRGTTRGRQLTWYSGNDRLLVDGQEGQPAVSVIRRK